MRKAFFAAAIGAAFLISVPAAAGAVEDPGYTPDEPSGSSLAGTSTEGSCHVSAPFIDYFVQLNGTSASEQAYLELSNGSESVEIDLGTVAGGSTLSGEVLWPGATVDSAGNATGWPGWTTDASGALVATDGNFAWTTGDISAAIYVADSSISVPLSYPGLEDGCAGPSSAATGDALLPSGLPATGMDAAVMPLSIAGGAIALAGAGALLVQRRRRSRA